MFDHVIQNKDKLCITKEDQLLLYVKVEKRVKKIREIHILEMDFTLLNKKNGLMISVLTGCAVEGIGKSMVYIALSISTCKAKSSCTNISKILTH